MKMDQRIKGLWLTALRSGDYEQARGYLHLAPKGGKDSFCCLGVLCEVAIADGVDLEKVNHEGITWYDGCFGGLPLAVRRWAEMSELMGGNTSRGEDLSELNDRGVSFTEIANIIEEEF